MVSVHSIEFEAHLKILKPSAIYLRLTDFIFTTRICCCLYFFSLNICFCGGELSINLLLEIIWNYHVFLRNFGDQPTPCRWAPRRGFAIAAGREEGAPRALHPDCSSHEQMERSPGKCRAAELYQWKTWHQEWCQNLWDIERSNSYVEGFFQSIFTSKISSKLM